MGQSTDKAMSNVQIDLCNLGTHCDERASRH